MHACEYFVTDGLAKDCDLGLRQRFFCRCPISNSRLVFDSSSKTTQGMCFWFFENLKMSSFGHFQCFLPISAKIDGSPILLYVCSGLMAFCIFIFYVLIGVLLKKV